MIFVLNANSGQPGILATMVTFLPLLMIFGIFYFLTIRPQRKRERELRNQVNQLTVGDTVVTIGGIVGKVMNVSGDEITLASSVANTMMTFKKSAIGTVVSAKNEPIKTVSEEPQKEKKKLFSKKSDIE